MGYQERATDYLWRGDLDDLECNTSAEIYFEELCRPTRSNHALVLWSVYTILAYSLKSVCDADFPHKYNAIDFHTEPNPSFSHYPFALRCKIPLVLVA